MGYGSATITTLATQIVAANDNRLSFVMTNKGAADVYFGADSSITVNGCPYLVTDGTFAEDSGGMRVWMGPFFGITSSGTATILYWERERGST